ncbi:MAG: alpha/beta hydrolase [Candidatus Latescibacteria bacterium]|nr:alpha/beta hydrolase [Candidatus Latescibacterota bacterium]
MTRGYCQRPWGDMAYRVRKSPDSRQPPLLLIHSSGCNSRHWDPVLPHLLGDLRLAACDLFGHGESSVGDGITLDLMAEDLLALVDHLSMESPVLVGHSLGGMLALRIVGRWPQRVAGAALIEGWTLLSGLKWEARKEMYGTLSNELIESTRKKSRDTYARCPERVHESFWETVKSADGSQTLMATHLPVLEMYGDRGGPIPSREHLGVLERSNVEMVWIEGAAQYSPTEAAQEVGVAISKWLETSVVL